MQIGIFSKTFEGNLETIFKKLNTLGIYHTQFNLTSAGMETLPDHRDEISIKKVKDTAEKYKIKLDAISGTFNMIDPDTQRRADGIRRFGVLSEIASILEIPIITLCTGSKNPQSKWKWDEKNLSSEAWDDLMETTEQLLAYAHKSNLILGIETEASNIINTPYKAREYLDSFKSKHLGIIMDGANLFLPSQVCNMEAVLNEAFELLGKDIVLAHGKDITNGSELDFVAAGDGVLDFDIYIQLLRKYKYHGPFIMHGLSEKQIPGSLEFLKGKLGYV